MITTQEIAKEFGLSRQTVYVYLAPSANSERPRVKMVQDYAAAHGWESQAQRREHKPTHYWRGGCFLTQAAEKSRMEELREEGYSNREIAKKVGRSHMVVYRAIGRQSEEMTKQNLRMGGKIRAQKNAARKQYVINEPILAYNRVLEEAKSVETHLAKIRADLAAAEEKARKNARRTVKTPSINLSTTQIAG